MAEVRSVLNMFPFSFMGSCGTILITFLQRVWSGGKGWHPNQVCLGEDVSEKWLGSEDVGSPILALAFLSLQLCHEDY